jgi:hypothetical protein
MGLAGYYRRFIEGFSKIAHPITSLQKKGVRFESSSDCEKIFEHLKSLLTSAPILRISDLHEYFVVYILIKKGLGESLVRMGTWYATNQRN